MPRCVIIGNSAAGLAAIEAIRSRNRNCPITLIGAERHPPYSRIMLTYLLAGKTTLDRIALHEPDWYRQMNVQALTGRRAVAIDLRRGEVLTEGVSRRGRTRHVSFDRLLIATGSNPQRPKVDGIDLPGVFCLRNLDDAAAITSWVDGQLSGSHPPEAVFLGGGPVCLQTLTALAARGARVTLLVRSAAILSQLADAYTAALAENVLRARGIRIIPGAEVSGIDAGRGAGGSRQCLMVHTRQCRPLPADLVIVGKGTEPNIELIRGTGIATEAGILVDETMATSAAHVFAAGDVAQATHCVTGRKVCFGTWTNACEQGRIAGLNMAGSRTAWTGGLNRNVTTLFGNTLGSVGVIHADTSREGEGHVPDLLHFKDPRHRTSRRLLFAEGRCLGAVLWNACDDLGTLSWLIGSRRDCTGWESRMARGEKLWADALAPKLTRASTLPQRTTRRQ